MARGGGKRAGAPRPTLRGLRPVLNYGVSSPAESPVQQIVLSAANILLPLAYLMVAIDYAFLFFAAHPVAVKTATPALRWTVALHLSYLVALGVRHGQFPFATLSQA